MKSLLFVHVHFRYADWTFIKSQVHAVRKLHLFRNGNKNAWYDMYEFDLLFSFKFSISWILGVFAASSTLADSLRD